TAAYTYDPAGNTLTRPAPVTGNQTLTWDAEGHLASVTDTSGSTSFIYDADGNRLIRKDPTGKTLYLPNSELRHPNATGTHACTRFYDFGPGTIAQRTTSAVTWLAADHQGTQDVAIDADSQAATARRQTPFGGPRGGTVSWPSEKGFVGGTTDPTGLTH